MHLTGLLTQPLALVVMLVILGAWILRSHRSFAHKPLAAALSFLLVFAGWVGLHEVPPLGWALILMGFLVPLAARR